MDVHAGAVVVLLLLQYALGMAANLWLVFPDSAATEGAYFEAAWSQGVFGAHVVDAIVTFLLLVALFVRAVRAKSRAWAAASFASLAGVGMSIAGGVTFVGSQDDSFSYLMAWGFAIASGSVLAALVFIPRTRARYTAAAAIDDGVTPGKGTAP